ncbi:hypothetical protein PPO43_02375 [Saprospira sp. CCB-QB6]|uniref:DUF7793 family protein n=1 Tax=Saprospira sp. CCB-QB6 TaxID=3023936 RepID=UPI00234BEED6|nr:hypothetical protein [Saprospira sp. CCB-QB6]WCL81945.1 hypothetical protein PPO43_02375 [Saprospira sp. CCB-QB6]
MKEEQPIATMEQLQKLGQTQNSAYFMRPDGLILATTVNSTPLTKTVILENFELIKQISTDLGQPIKILAESEQLQRLSRCARDYMRTEEAQKYDQYVIGTAMLTQNQLAKMLANFIMGLRKQARPMKIFTNKADALVWLKSL